MKRKVIWNNKLLISITVLIILMAGSINLYNNWPAKSDREARTAAAAWADEVQDYYQWSVG